MSETPEGLTLAQNRDRTGRREVRVRRALVTLLCLFLLAALLNVFGQRPSTSEASVAAAELKVYAPTRVRGGLYYEARFDVRAREDIADATLVLDPGWLEGMTVNTIEPSPVSEASRDGNLVLGLGHIRPGRRYLLFMQLQVNPTNVGQRSTRLWLYDGDRLLTSVDRTITIYP